jgi:uncharacterized pyridoxamine 5'-phosphate oxidase family protein
MAANIDFGIFDDEGTLDFIATVNKDGSPHITVFSSVMKYDDSTLMFGEYCRGVSKSNLSQNPKAAIFAFSPDKQWVRGGLRWKEKRNSGPEHELFNNIPRFRYNAIYGYEWVHILSVTDFEGRFRPDEKAAASAAAHTIQIANTLPALHAKEAVPQVGCGLFGSEDSLKLLAYISKDGYPKLIYLPQASLVGTDNVIWNTEYSEEDLDALANGTEVSLISYVPKLAASLLVKGPVMREKVGDADITVLDITRVYNGNTPKAGYIFPAEPLAPIREFEGAYDV